MRQAQVRVKSAQVRRAASRAGGRRRIKLPSAEEAAPPKAGPRRRAEAQNKEPSYKPFRDRRLPGPGPRAGGTTRRCSGPLGRLARRRPHAALALLLDLRSAARPAGGAAGQYSPLPAARRRRRSCCRLPREPAAGACLIKPASRHFSKKSQEEYRAHVSEEHQAHFRPSDWPLHTGHLYHVLLNAMLQPRVAAATCKRWSLNFYLFCSGDRHLEFSSPFLNSLADKPIAEAAQLLLKELRDRPVSTRLSAT